MRTCFASYVGIGKDVGRVDWQLDLDVGITDMGRA